MSFVLDEGRIGAGNDLDLELSPGIGSGSYGNIMVVRVLGI